ncbi:DUF4124 domain-containing protein [Thauera sp. 2A1]|uniref:DUF4124 domain-containing protein n=1 Tax=Thauera sp. 2A1 TaxID=2570191 RepID=UPI0012916548|nr:DUF4124 domain-containing protein [Thauera sp. 2A1]KAI5914592.1 DUF4124 domain-containing protein [Thauera sp. 2A1]
MRAMALLWGLLIGGMAQAQVYKCVEGGKTVYSQEPCGTKPQTLDIQRSTPRPGSFAETQSKREDYIRANPGLSETVKGAIRGGVAVPGMTEDQVIAAMGAPLRRNLTQTASVSMWQWVYRYGSGRQHYVYIENGLVVATN